MRSHSIEAINYIVKEFKSQTSDFFLDMNLDIEKADLLERWEAVLLDPEFPDRNTHIRVLSMLIKAVEDGHVTLKSSEK